MTVILAAAAFAVFGGLIGLLIGMTASSVVSGFIPIAFAFFGGSVIPLMKDMQPRERALALVALLFLSLGTIGGLFGGISASEYQILTPKSLRESDAKGVAPDGARRERNTYLREIDHDFLTSVDQRVRSNVLTKEQAYDAIITKELAVE